ncbi:MAG: endo-1,4-beta-xylanase [Treponema sp.]|nr:endo-1,4-beta-xylanase [Treponema sp.]
MISKNIDAPDTAYDPYFRDDPGEGVERVPVHIFDLEHNFSVWKSWRTNDGRVLPNVNSGFEHVNDPFETGSLIMLTTHFDPVIAGKAFGGFGMRAPISPAISMNNQTFVEFDLFYPKSAVGKYMRFEIWSTSTGGEGFQGEAGFPGNNRTQVYIRTSDIESLAQIKPEWIGFHEGETWYKKSISAVTPVSSGTWEYLNIDLHTETGTKLEGDKLLIGNIRITRGDSSGVPIPDIVNLKNYLEVEPVKSKYNPGNGYFYIGTVGTRDIDPKLPIEPKSLLGYHFEILADENNLKPERHVRPPQWLKDLYPKFNFRYDGEGTEWELPTEEYLNIRNSHTDGGGEYKIHGHCLAWINQSPPWMRQMLPENVTSMQWNSSGLFYTGGTNAIGPYLKVNKETARRIYYNHILYQMRHFMTTDARYDSSKERGIIPFHSFDVVNVEIHESRHSTITKDNPVEWKSALRHVSWFMAMTDDNVGDIRQNYMYLLYKYAHIAIPNAQMAEKYKAHFNDPDIVPEYMKLDNHDDNGSIDAFVSDKPPLLVYNDYEINVWSKMTVAFNMIKELNTAWKTDPLYDGRNLVECLGIQGHGTVNPNIASQNQRAVAFFADLINEGLLDSICYSEVDVRQPDGAPGGEALAPAVLNQKQADAIAYQYALFFKTFENYKKYIDHVIIWSPHSSGWMSSYVLFDHEKMASQAYYAVMDPDRFIQGHSYLDSYFIDEYNKIKSS